MAKGSRGGKRVQAYINAGGRFPAHFARTHGINGAGVGGGSGTTGGGGSSDTVQQVQPATSISADFNAFSQMSDDDKADVITSMRKQGVPAHLAQNDFQAFIYNIGLNDKPDVVDDATLNKMSGTTIYRTVNNHYDRRNDISYNADQIAKQIQGGSITRVSETGGSVYGRGLYFADSKSGSAAYGGTRGNVKRTAQVRAKLNSNARIINHSNAAVGAQKEIAKGTKLGKALAKCDYDSQASIYALCKGYNVITSGRGYYNVLNRQAMTMSKTISPI